MNAAARNTRKNTAIACNAARKSIPRSTRLIPPSITTSPSPSFSALQAALLSRAKHESAMRSARATAAHAVTRHRPRAWTPASFQFLHQEYPHP